MNPFAIPNAFVGITVNGRWRADHTESGARPHAVEIAVCPSGSRA
jgi:hypothetical protein